MKRLVGALSVFLLSSAWAQDTAQYSSANYVVQDNANANNSSVDGSNVEQNMYAGEVCKRNEEGLIVCKYIGTGNGQGSLLQPSLAHGFLTWEALQPRWPDKMPIDQQFCLKKKEHVLAKFVMGAYSGNLNKLLDTYYWGGHTDETSLVVMERLAQVMAVGHWERSRLNNWDGPKSFENKYPIYVRWVTDNTKLPILHFTLRQDQGCWFLNETRTPSDTVQADGVYSEGRILFQNNSDGVSSQTVQPDSYETSSDDGKNSGEENIENTNYIILRENRNNRP